MTYPLADSVRMKLRNHQFYSEPVKPRIFEDSDYDHPWYSKTDKLKLKKPNPPTEEQIKKAKFIDKTYEWKKK
tara:strand:- start:879 stop:1097 length:219 start_codon:yes stop_codon:yes gene_type:complete